MPFDTISSLNHQKPRRSRRPRPVSERRREQNRIAQKTYRDKKKDYLLQLENLAKTTPMPSSHIEESQQPGKRSESNQSAPEQDLLNCDVSTVSSLFGVASGPGHDYLPALTPFDHTEGVTLEQLQYAVDCSDATFEADDPGPGQGPNTVFPVQPDGVPRYIDRVAETKYPSNLENNPWAPSYPMNQVPFSSSRLMTALKSNDDVSRHFSLEDILVAGIGALSAKARQKDEISSKCISQTSFENPLKAAHQEQRGIPDIHMNTIQLTTMSFIAACFANAAMIGLSPDALWDSTTQSPFYHMEMPNTAHLAHLKPLLQPSTTQVTHPHHPYLDILPLPAFRNRTIQLLQIQPPPFDPAELCEDLKNDGIVCWGSTRADRQDSLGSGAPWDIRSWEVKPWFLKKWWILFDGPDGEMYQHSRWWCELRGENSCYPW
ncbi:conserved hypothetical protein [Paecilomyces variotii No. 5]|uniref:BZIP domain-containing protein n=1 Tax=Byssochlamys spectabilis (strain No. 5 / NBRC 109023) TaxID=1356009 RepID=V5G1A2_BYSSN|nr:conserved hypothetical protein [Paecilomyces variotii No. 5]